MLPLNSLSTCPLAGELLPEGHVWTEVQVQRVFKRGQASGTRNICWFDSVAQLKLDMPRGEVDNGLVDHLAKQLRTAADRFGLSRDGEMFDDDNGSMQLIASIYLYSDDVHFTPLRRD